MSRKCVCSSRTMFFCTASAVVLLVVSLVMAFWGLPRIIVNQIHKQTELSEGTDQWERFKELPFPMEYNVRFFNVTNPTDILNGSKPILTESATYKYKTVIKKTDIRFDDIAEDSVTFRRSFSFQFDDSGTTSEDDEITVINPLLMASFQLTNDIQRLAMAGCMEYILKPAGLDQLFLTTTVRRFLFDGINFAFKNATNKGVACEIVRQLLGDIVSNVRVIEHCDDTDDDYYRLAIFNYKTDNYLKDSPDGIFTINRGRDNGSALGTIMRWNGITTRTTYGTWMSTNNETCQAIKGTDSTIYSPQLQENRNLFVYNTDLCRTVQLEQVESNATFNGIKAFKYTPGKNLFRPATLLKENDCYCSYGTKNAAGKRSCFLDGLLDYKPCLGAPALISQPHFLHADAEYLSAVSGLSPDEDQHGIYLLLEPNTGTPLEGKKRIQMNTVLHKQPLLSTLTPATMFEGVFPLLWLEEGFTLPQEYVDELNEKYFKPVRITTAIKYSLMGATTFLLVACLFVVWRKTCFRNAN